MEKGRSEEEAEWEAAQSTVIDPKKELKLLAKLDLAFIPVIMLVYLSCFLDRSNIGTHLARFAIQ